MVDISPGFCLVFGGVPWLNGLVNSEMKGVGGLWSERCFRKKKSGGWRQATGRHVGHRRMRWFTTLDNRPQLDTYVPSFFVSGDTCEFFVLTLRFGSKSQKLSSTYPCGAGRGSNKHKEYLRKAYKTCFVAKDRCRLVDSDDNVRQVRLAAGGHGNCRRQLVEMPWSDPELNIDIALISIQQDNLVSFKGKNALQLRWIFNWNTTGLHIDYEQCLFHNVTVHQLFTLCRLYVSKNYCSPLSPPSSHNFKFHLKESRTIRWLRLPMGKLIHSTLEALDPQTPTKTKGWDQTAH